MSTHTAAQPALDRTAPQNGRWTRADCHALRDAGKLDYPEYELLDGVLIPRMSKKMPHVQSSMELLWRLAASFGQDYVLIESPVDVHPQDNPTNEPQPDLVVVTKPERAYAENPPPSSDIRLLIEVAESSLSYDRGPKARLYARAGIPDYWVYDVAGRRIVVHRDPVDGVYRSVVSVRDAIAPLADPSVRIAVAEVD